MSTSTVGMSSREELAAIDGYAHSLLQRLFRHVALTKTDAADIANLRDLRSELQEIADGDDALKRTAATILVAFPALPAEAH